MATESPPIFTAILFHKGDKDYDNNSMVTAATHHGEIPMGNHEEEEDKLERKSLQKLIGLGILVGSLSQVFLLRLYYVIILVHCGDNVVQKTEGDHQLLHYTILSILAQINKCIYVVICCMAFACAFARFKLMMTPLDEFQIQVIRRKLVFVSGILSFLVGTVTGTFITASMIVVYLGFPIPVFLSIAVATVDVTICYVMISGFEDSKTLIVAK